MSNNARRRPLSALRSANSAQRVVSAQRMVDDMAAITLGGDELGPSPEKALPERARPTSFSLNCVLDALTPARASEVCDREEDLECEASVGHELAHRFDSEDEIEEWDSDVDSPKRLGTGAAAAPSERISDKVRWMRTQEVAHAGAHAALGPGGIGGILLEGRQGLSAPEIAHCIVRLVAELSSAAPRAGALYGTLLVVAPARLPYWVKACALIAPGVRVLVHHGPCRARSVGALGPVDLVLTTYQLLSAAEFCARPCDVLDAHEAGSGGVWRRRADRTSDADGEATLSLLHLRPWARVVFDESDRHLTQLASKRSRAARAVLAPCRWALAGIAARGCQELQAAVLSSIGLDSVSSD
jgi:hypothetical protein